MNDFIAARSQMGVSLGFHIIFACIGMVMPIFMAVSHYKWLRTGDIRYKNITRAWSRGVAIFFVTGAVSGTMLSFELGLLWPGFMKYAGPIIGMPFSLEGVAFFIEAIALGFFLYGWDKLNKRFHWFTGLLTGLTGVTSGILVVSANAWMNSPAGFTYIPPDTPGGAGQFLDISPWRAMSNAAWAPEALHMILAAFVATGFAVAGVHAWMVYRRKNRDFHFKAFRIAITFSAVAAILQPFSGDFAARSVSRQQPAKLAAMESLFHSQPKAPLLIGGIPDIPSQTVKYGIELPGMLSFLVHDNIHASVTGLDAIPEAHRPPVIPVHLSFQLMVLVGILLFLLGVLYLYGAIRHKRWLQSRWFLKCCILAIPLGFIAIEAGWMVTELGRQPWIIYGIMFTRDALTPMPGIQYTFYLFTLIYVILSAVIIFLLYRQIKMVPKLYDTEG